MFHTSSQPSAHEEISFDIGNSIKGSSSGSKNEVKRMDGECQISAARERTKELRDKVMNTRLELRELRVELQHSHARIWKMQVRFWQGLEDHWEEEGKSDKALARELHDDIRGALDSIGPRQDLYDETEDSLVLLEYRLEKQESRYYELEVRLRGTFKAESTHSASSSATSQRSRRPGSQLIDDENSATHRFLSRVGDAKILKERLSELVAERNQYLDIERERVALGLPLYQPNVDFLSTFDDVYAAQIDELRIVEEDLQRLELETNVMHPSIAGHAPHGSPHTIDIPLSVYHNDQYQTSTFSGSPKLLRCQSDGGFGRGSIDIFSIRQRINQWILDNLATSAIERARHKAIIDNPGLDNRAWWSLVEEYWQTDRASQSPGSSPGSRSNPFAVGSSAPIPIPEPSIMTNEINNQAGQGLECSPSSSDMGRDSTFKHPLKPLGDHEYPMVERSFICLDEYETSSSY